MSAASHPSGGARVAALAGRRIDAEGAEPTRFPLARSAVVRAALRDLMRDEALGLLVCSAACGSDLLALDAALELGLRCRVVIPYAQTEFRRTSVTDRPGEWGPMYDRVIANMERAGDLVVLAASPSDDRAYSQANEAIVRYAAEAAAPARALAILVWEGQPREGEDATAEFKQFALAAGMRERTVLTCSD